MAFKPVDTAPGAIAWLVCVVQLTDIASDLDTQDSTFKMVRGLSGAPGSVSE